MGLARVLRLGGVQLGFGTGAAIAPFEPPQQAAEAVLGEEGGKRFGRALAQLHIVNRDRQFAIFLQRNQNAAEFGIGAMFEQAFLQLALFHLRRRVECGGERSVILDQFGRGLRADPEDAGDVVDRIAHQREHVAHQFGRDAELLFDLGGADPRALHRIEHIDRAALFAGADQLHQVLVGRDDGDVPALRCRGAGVGGDHVVRLDAGFLDHRQAERAGGVANQRELRDEVLGRIGPVGLVLVVNLVAEALARLVEHHREVRWPLRLVEILGQLPQHGGVAIDCAHRGALRIGQRGQAMIRAKDVRGTVDEIEVLLVGHGPC